MRSNLLGIKNSFSFKRPFDKILRSQQALDETSQRLITASKHTVELERERLIGCASRLDSVSPLKVLGRGYSITTGADSDKPIKCTEGLVVGKTVKTRFSHGGIVSAIVEIRKEI